MVVFEITLRVDETNEVVVVEAATLEVALVKMECVAGILRAIAIVRKS